MWICRACATSIGLTAECNSLACRRLGYAFHREWHMYGCKYGMYYISMQFSSVRPCLRVQVAGFVRRCCTRSLLLSSLIIGFEPKCIIMIQVCGSYAVTQIKLAGKCHGPCACFLKCPFLQDIHYSGCDGTDHVQFSCIKAFLQPFIAVKLDAGRCCRHVHARACVKYAMIRAQQGKHLKCSRRPDHCSPGQASCAHFRR